MLFDMNCVRPGFVAIGIGDHAQLDASKLRDAAAASVRLSRPTSHRPQPELMGVV
jgi:hypothetical protein